MKDTAMDILNASAWKGFVIYAWSEQSFHKQYVKDTNRSCVKMRLAPIELAIDRACGHVGDIEIDMEYMKGFVDWVTEAFWGADMDPRTEQEPTP